MNLPLVVDIAIGLIFIYLTFSLLTSEIQELITTLLQWRAVHLKESIEGLLSGSNETPELKQARILANKLYSNPVINTLNQEAKGFAASLPRRFNKTVGNVFRDILKRDNVFGQKNSGPSYIASESFATSLFETLGIPSVIQKFTLLRMQEFKSEFLDKVKVVLQDAAIPGIDQYTLKFEFKNKEEETEIQKFLNNNFENSDIRFSFYVLKKTDNLRIKIDETIEGFRSGGFDLEKSVDRLEEVLLQYIESLESYVQEDNLSQNELITNVKNLQNDLFGKPRQDSSEVEKGWSSEKSLLLRSLQPNLTEAVEIIKGFWQLKKSWSIYKDVRKGAAIDAIFRLKTTINNQQNIPDAIRQKLLKRLDNISASSSKYGYERISEIINKYPRLNRSVKQRLRKEVKSIIDSSYDQIKEVIGNQQEGELPENIRNTLLQIIEEARTNSSVSSLSYEFEKVRRTEIEKFRKALKKKTDLPTETVEPASDRFDENAESMAETPALASDRFDENAELSAETPALASDRLDENTESSALTTPSFLDEIDEIIEATDEIIDNSYEEIKNKINSENRLPISTREGLLNLLNAITNSSLDFEYETIRKAIENQPGLTRSIKDRFLSEVDNTINSCLQDEYEKFTKAVEAQPNLDIPVKQSLLLLATAITLRKDNELAKLVDQLLGMGSLPEPLERNLLLLAQQAQIKVEGVKEELNQFRREVENWFDRSMERSSGVYRRNAKLVAIILGSLVAVAVNADTVHIVTRLSKDQILRSQVSRAADQIATDRSDLTARCLSYPTEAQRSADPDCTEVLNKLNSATDNLSLPIGWGKANRLQQSDEAKNWGMFGFLQYPLGWLVSGIALSMGASFWYELLGKFINVRNVGKKPPSPKDQPNSDQD